MHLGKPSCYSRTDSVRQGSLAKETAVSKLQQKIIQNNSMHYSYNTSLTAHQGEKNSSCVRIFQLRIFCSVTLYSMLQSISFTQLPETQRQTVGQVLVVGKDRKTFERLIVTLAGERGRKEKVSTALGPTNFVKIWIII